MGLKPKAGKKVAKKVGKKTTTRRAPPKAVRRKLNLDRATEKREELDDRKQSIFHDLEQGWNFFFVMLPFDDDDVIWHEVQQHGWGRNCPDTTAGRACLMCKEIAKRLRRGDTDFEQEFRLRSRGFLNAIRKEHVEGAGPEHVKVLGMPSKLFDELIDWITLNRDDPSDVENAVLLGIHRKGAGITTKYKPLHMSNDRYDISDHVTTEVLGALYNLKELRAAQPASDKDLREAIRKFEGGDTSGPDAWEKVDEPADEGSELEDDLEGEEENAELEDNLFEEPADLDAELVDDEEGEGELGEYEDEEPAPPKRVVKKVVKKKVVRRVRKAR